MSFYEKHYEMCRKYIYACSHPDKYTCQELFEITRQQRLSEGEFMRMMDGRKNITYPALCLSKAKENRDKDMDKNKQFLRRSERLRHKN